jgi:diaminopimelate epimerase
MAINFHKYHGTGNDFILIDDRSNALDTSGKGTQAAFSAWCNRQTGIGADGIILLRNAVGADFEMVFFNSDGRPGSMCGNGGRCIVAFADKLGITGNHTNFLAPDGMHQARLTARNKNIWNISVGLRNAAAPEKIHDGVFTDRGNQAGEKINYFVHTGSPHLVVFSAGVEKLDVVSEGRRIRNLPAYREQGINVNFAEVVEKGTLFVRTYERGVENETLSCGTGVTAAALAYWQWTGDQQPTKIITRGGHLSVSFTPPTTDKGEFSEIYLHGPAELVFSGTIRP